MADDKITTRSENNRMFTVITIIIVIAIILSAFYLWIQFERPEKLEFKIELVKSPFDITQKNIYYQFKNADDKAITFLSPEIGKNLDFIIKAKNGTEYQYAGPVTYSFPWWQTLSSGEFENGTQKFGTEIHTFDIFSYNYTMWKNTSKNEYWFFQPGTYKIYGTYESKSNKDFENVLVGTWKSNAVELTIEPKFIEITTDKSTYSQGENITIYMKNIGDVTLNQTSGWESYTILNYYNEIIYQQNAVTMQLTDLTPNEKVIVGIWRQTYNNESQVRWGSYLIEKYYAGHSDATDFFIKD